MELQRAFPKLWEEWHLEELLGKGSFGSVYRAVKKDYGYTFTSAVKYFSVPNEEVPSFARPPATVLNDPAALARFYDEVRDRIMTEIRIDMALKGYTNIVSVDDYSIFPKKGGIGYDIFIRMECLTTLTAYMKEHPLTETDIIRIGADMCAALEVMEKHQILHRDIKPENIFVSETGVFKLGDFGEAKFYTDVPTDMDFHGTYTYMPPEIIKRRKTDVRSDLYSLGIVLYRLINGNRAPFIPSDLKQIDQSEQDAANNRRFRGEPLPLPQFSQNSALVEIIMKACQFKPNARWQHPRLMRKALEALLDETADESDKNSDSQSQTAVPVNAAISDRYQPEPLEPEPKPTDSGSVPKASKEPELAEESAGEEEPIRPKPDLSFSETDEPSPEPAEGSRRRRLFRRKEPSERARRIETLLCWVIFLTLLVCAVAYLVYESVTLRRI